MNNGDKYKRYFIVAGLIALITGALTIKYGDVLSIANIVGGISVIMLSRIGYENYRNYKVFFIILAIVFFVINFLSAIFIVIGCDNLEMQCKKEKY